MTTRQEQLAHIECEFERQNEAWERAKRALTSFGDVQFAIPTDALEAIGAPQTPCPPPPAGSVRA